MDDFELIEDAIEKDIEDLKEGFRVLGEFIGETLDDAVEQLKELLSDKAIYRERPKYKPVKSLIKPYTPPTLKVKYKARANLRRERRI